MIHKPNTIPDEKENTAALLDWLACYPFMRRKAGMWFRHQSFSEAELQAVAAVFPPVSLELAA